MGEVPAPAGSQGAPECNWEEGGVEGVELSHFCSRRSGREGEKETQALLATGDTKPEAVPRMNSHSAGS